jgi:hypothetical protein
MSNNAPSTAGSNDTVIGWIDYYNSDKKFGFAYAGSDRVFFHLSACREVEGTPEVPVLTDRRNSEAPTWYRGSRHAEQIVLRVVPGTKGPMALVWGHLPKRTWLEKMLHWKTLTAFDHGEVNILYSTHQRGRSHREVIGRMTQAPTLEPGDPWRLTIKFDYYQNHYSGRSGEKVLTFELRPYEAFPSKSRPEDCAMDIYIPSSADNGEWAHIVFCPNWSWPD